MICLTQLSKRKLEALTCPRTKFRLFLQIISLPKSFLSSRLQNGFSCCSHGGSNVYWVQWIDSITPKMLMRVILNLLAFQPLQKNRVINFLFWKVILYFSNTRALKFREYALKIESTAELLLTMDIFGFRRAPDISKMLEFSGKKIKFLLAKRLVKVQRLLWDVVIPGSSGLCVKPLHTYLLGVQTLLSAC